jgi:hypothetical protein
MRAWQWMLVFALVLFCVFSAREHGKRLERARIDCVEHPMAGLVQHECIVERLLRPRKGGENR